MSFQFSESSGRRANTSAMRASESMFAEMQKQQQEAAARRARQAAQDEALAAELERRKREEESKRREIQRICEADPELRALQEKLKVMSGCAAESNASNALFQRDFPLHFGTVGFTPGNGGLADAGLLCLGVQMAYVTKERLDQKRERQELTVVSCRGLLRRRGLLPRWFVAVCSPAA